MNYIYDVVLNFFDYKNTFEFYQWLKEDKLTYTQRIPIFKVNPIQMEEIDSSKIKITDEFLNKIRNKTLSDNGFVFNAILITDYKRVIALKFNDYGELINKSYLLFDEEDSILDEVREFDMECFNYQIIEKYKVLSFYTRREIGIKNYLIKEINLLYKSKKYDEIDYLYYELFNDNDNTCNKYKRLIDTIENDYDNKFDNLYDIIELSKQGILNN